MRPSQLDFSNSGQSTVSVTTVQFDETQFFNAIELLDYDDGGFQTQICSCCGVEGCSSGSWVSMRCTDNHIIFAPAIEAMREGKWESEEYSPPYFLRKYGAPALTKSQYKELTEMQPQLPSLGDIPTVKMEDWLAILQLEAPGYILGNITGEIKLDTERIIAVTDGNLENEISTFKNLIHLSIAQEKERVRTSFDRKVEFILDLPNFPFWSPFGYTGETPHLIANIKNNP